MEESSLIDKVKSLFHYLFEQNEDPFKISDGDDDIFVFFNYIPF